jgi:hypothetical protein
MCILKAGVEAVSKLVDNEPQDALDSRGGQHCRFQRNTSPGVSSNCELDTELPNVEN